MRVFICRWMILGHLSYVASSSMTVRGSSPCQRNSVLLQSTYAASDRETTGGVGLTDTFALVVVDNGTVRYPYPWLSVRETAVEVNFTRHQDVVLRDLRTHFPRALTVSVSHFCSLERNISCDVICKIDDDFIVVSEGEIIQRTLQDQNADRICKTKYGFSLLERSWNRIFSRWWGLCSYFEGAERTRVNISFTYHAETNASWCNASVSEPVHCKLTVYHREEVVGSKPCARDGAAVGAALSYEPTEDQDLHSLKCSVSGNLLKEVFTRLETRDRDDHSDAAGYGRTDGGTNAGLGVGVVFALLVALAVSVVAFRKRLGLRVLDRAVDRVCARLTYLRAETR